MAKCELCNGTGFYGDNGPGIEGNAEYAVCENCKETAFKREGTMNDYTKDWPMIAEQAKKQNGWKCERCDHCHDPGTGHTLTVHHLDGDKANNQAWNLAVLCQRCHLSVQGRVRMEQMLLPGAEVSEWFKPHLEGYNRAMEMKKAAVEGEY